MAKSKAKLKRELQNSEETSKQYIKKIKIQEITITTLLNKIERMETKQSLCVACGIIFGMLLFEILRVICKILGV